MTDKDKKLIENLRYGVMFCAHCSNRATCAVECSAYQDAQSAADLIERLSMELEAVMRDVDTVAHDGNDVCAVCKHYDCNTDGYRDCENCKDKCPCIWECEENSHFEWRGLCAENGGKENAAD